MTKQQKRFFALGVLLGAVYGLAAFVGLRHENALTTASFLFLVPAGMGALSLIFSDEDQLNNYQAWLFAPWVAFFTFSVALVALFGEGALCFVVIGLPFAGVILLTTTIVWAVRATRIRARKKAAAAVVIALLPFVLAPLEQRHLTQRDEHVSFSEIVVEAPVTSVWNQLAEVDTIEEGEYQPSIFNRLGVPRPIRATVNFAGLGGHRVGEFTHGLTFDETISVFEPPQKMSFTIQVDPAKLREGSAERHAFEVGYFRFIDATYALEQLGPERTRLVLSSRYVLESGVNWYGRLWAETVIGDFQDRVLAIIGRRVERAWSGPVARR